MKKRIINILIGLVTVLFLAFLTYGYVTDAGAIHYTPGPVNTDRLQWVTMAFGAAVWLAVYLRGRGQ